MDAAAAEAVELRRIRLPLITPFRTSLGVETERDVLLVRAFTDAGEGWAECVAMGDPHYSPEYVDGAHAVIRRHLLPLLFAGAPLSAVKGHQMAKAALEAAVIDAQLRAAGVSLAAHLGGIRTAVAAGVSVGMADSLDELVSAVAGFVSAGYQRVKLKIEPGWDVEPVGAVRREFPDLMLQVDANGSYTVEDAAHLTRLDEHGLLLLEQPLGEDDLVGHAEIARRMATPVCLDESIASAGDAETALALGACSVINVKPGRVGGIREAQRIHDLCVARGVPVWCGGMLETGIGRAVNVALASLPGFTLPGDLSGSDRYFETDITEPFVLRDGCLAVPSGAGIGVTPIDAVLDEVTTSVEVVRATDL